ncbi:hypothetical protein HanRHA438_Chr11g0508491 [Helianthus annuus]|nr:hypothetical protein HanRHA438_Chr11g0508491 [Helianthus annuus]
MILFIEVIYNINHLVQMYIQRSKGPKTTPWEKTGCEVQNFRVGEFTDLR